MILRRLNDAGIAGFRDVLERCRDGESISSPLPLVTNDSLAEPLANRVELPEATFDTRLELAKTVSEAVARASVRNEMNDTGLWAWLSAAYFDTVCPPENGGHRRPGEEYRHIPGTGHWHFYRHLVRGPVRVYRLFADDPHSARIVLCQNPATPGDFVEQLAARQERIMSPAVIGVATALYYDPERGKPKRGASPTERKPGTLRRYLDVLDQMSLTWDIYAMRTEDLLELLPAEFEPWKPGGRTGASHGA